MILSLAVPFLFLVCVIAIDMDHSMQLSTFDSLYMHCQDDTLSTSSGSKPNTGRVSYDIVIMVADFRLCMMNQAIGS